MDLRVLLSMHEPTYRPVHAAFLGALYDELAAKGYRLTTPSASEQEDLIPDLIFGFLVDNEEAVINPLMEHFSQEGYPTETFLSDLREHLHDEAFSAIEDRFSFLNGTEAAVGFDVDEQDGTFTLFDIRPSVGDDYYGHPALSY